MPVDEVANDEDVRETYNFAPGYHGAVYRADIPDRGYDDQRHDDQTDADARTKEAAERREDELSKDHDRSQRYRLQAMRWGLVPFWTKRQPDYGSLMRTINCRDDSLIEDRGMWTSMKRRKRCVIICQGFYEWLKKGPGGKEKVPHFIKRKDGDLLCFAGLWDCVSYEGRTDSLGANSSSIVINYWTIGELTCRDQDPMRSSTLTPSSPRLQTRISSSCMTGCQSYSNPVVKP